MGLLLAVAGGVYAQDWPGFRNGSASGVAAGPGVPVLWNVEKGTNILWKREIPGFGHSGPIVWGDRVYVTSAVNKEPGAGVDTKAQVLTLADKGEFEWRLYAINKNTGEIVWQQVARTGAPISKRHPQSSQASCTPATNGKVVVAYFGTEGLYAFDMNGKLRWKKDLGTIETTLYFDPDLEYGTASSPVIYKDLVIVQVDKRVDSFIAAFGLKDGREVWRVARDEYPSWSTPVLVTGGKRDELITQAYKFTRSYDPASGRELWRFGRNGEQHIPSPALAGGLLYFTSIGDKASPIYALKPGGSGDISVEEGKPHSPFVAWYQARGGAHTVSPLVYQGKMYVTQDNGVVAVYDATSGERLYRTRLGKGGTYFASPIGAGGRVIFFNQDGEAFTLKNSAHYELVSENAMGEMVMSTPAISGSTLFVRGYKHLFAIKEAAAK
jgi:outer membrane protein assembly factor BamB